MAKKHTTKLPAGMTPLETTGGNLEGEFFDAEDGATLSGKLEGVFSLDGKYGARAVFRIRQADGTLALLSEKAAYRNALLAQRVGTTVFLEFVGKEDIVNRKTGKKTGQSVWKVNLAGDGKGKGAMLSDLLEKTAPAGKPAPAGDTEDVPF